MTDVFLVEITEDFAVNPEDIQAMRQDVYDGGPQTWIYLRHRKDAELINLTLHEVLAKIDGAYRSIDVYEFGSDQPVTLSGVSE